MKALLWKEYRERRLWAVPLAASVAGVVALGRGYTYCGEFGTFGGWIAFAALAGLLFGMSEFSGELAWGTPEFLFSRPVSWKRLVAAKLIFGFGLIAIAAILGAIVFRFTTPEPYRRFATLADLSPGIGWAFLIMAVPYLLGAACSVLFPGSIGAILTLVTVGAAFVGEWSLLREWKVLHGGLPLITALGWVLGLILATLLVVRFGLTLSIANRVKRFALVMVPIALVGALADSIIISVPQDRPQVRNRTLSVSPDSRFAVECTVTERYSPVYGQYEVSECAFIRLSDSKTILIVRADPFIMKMNPRGYDHAYNTATDIMGRGLQWTPNGTAYYLSQEYGPRDAKTKLYLTRYVVAGIRMLADGRLVRSRIRGDWAHDNVQYIVPSPDGRLAAVSVSYGWPRRPSQRLDIIDVERGVRLPVTIRGLGKMGRVGKHWGFRPGTFWWQSDNEIGYLENNEGRRIVRGAP